MPLFAAILAAATAPAAAPLTSAGPWTVHAEENMCLLERTYSSGAEHVSLVFEPMLDLPEMEMFVISDDHRAQQQYVGTFKISIDPGPRMISERYISVVSGAAHRRVTRLQAKRALLDGLNEGDTLTVQAAPIALSFAIPGPQRARVALQACIDDLRQSWGVGPRPAVPPMIEGDPLKFFNADSYPPDALRADVYGRVLVLLSIDTAGKVANCRVLSSAGPALNTGTCQAAVRMTFRPGRDDGGKPVPSVYALPVRWTLPGAPR